GLALDGVGGRGNRGRVAEITAGAGAERGVELIEQRYTGRNVELDDVRFADLIEHLHHGAQTVAVRHHQHVASRAQLRGNTRVPEGQYPRQRVLERFRGGSQLAVD